MVAALYGSECIGLGAPGLFVVIGTRARYRVQPLVGWYARSAAPWGAHFVLHGFPVAFGPAGLFAYEPHRLTTRRPLGWGRRYAAYADIERVGTDDRTVLLNGASWLTLSSAAAARSVAADIDAVRHADVAERLDVIRDRAAARLDTTGVRDRCRQVDAALRPLRVFSTALAVTSLGAIAAVLMHPWALMMWRQLALVAAMQLLFVLVFFFHGHSRLYPRDGADRLTRLLSMLLAFPSAFKAPEALTHGALGRFHWLAAALVMAPRAQVARLAGAHLRDLVHPDGLGWHDPEPEARAACASFRAIELELVRQALAAAGQTPDALMTAALDLADPMAVRRCPRCGAGYRERLQRCADCDVDLLTPAAAAPAPGPPSAERQPGAPKDAWAAPAVGGGPSQPKE